MGTSHDQQDLPRQSFKALYKGREREASKEKRWKDTFPQWRATQLRDALTLRIVWGGENLIPNHLCLGDGRPHDDIYRYPHLFLFFIIFFSGNLSFLFVVLFHFYFISILSSRSFTSEDRSTETSLKELNRSKLNINLPLSLEHYNLNTIVCYYVHNCSLLVFSMAYQTFWAIPIQCCSCRRTFLILIIIRMSRNQYGSPCLSPFSIVHRFR